MFKNTKFTFENRCSNLSPDPSPSIGEGSNRLTLTRFSNAQQKMFRIEKLPSPAGEGKNITQAPLSNLLRG